MTVPLQLPGREERFLDEAYPDVFVAADHLAGDAVAADFIEAVRTVTAEVSR